MPGTTATTLEEARDPVRWERAVNVALIELTDTYGKDRALKMVAKAADWAAPPDGKHAWPFEQGVELEAHLARVAELVRNKERRDPFVLRRAGSPDETERSAARDASPEQRVVAKDLLRQTALAIRERFANDPEVMAYFEWLLRPSPETEAAAPKGTARNDAMTRFARFVGPLRARLAAEPPARAAVAS